MPRPGARTFAPDALITVLVATAVFWIAYDNGAYALAGRASIAIAVWWAVAVVVLFGLLPREPAPRASLAIGGLLAALSLWTLASLLWSPSAEKAFLELDRVTLLLGVFVLVTVAATRRTIGPCADGLAAAIAVVATIALASRLLPGLLPERDLATFLPGAATRLSFPLGYWNGLAIFLSLGVPLLLRVALVARGSAVRGLALAPIPVIAVGPVHGRWAAEAGPTRCPLPVRRLRPAGSEDRVLGSHAGRRQEDGPRRAEGGESVASSCRAEDESVRDLLGSDRERSEVRIRACPYPRQRDVPAVQSDGAEELQVLPVRLRLLIASHAVQPGAVGQAPYSHPA